MHNVNWAAPGHQPARRVTRTHMQTEFEVLVNVGHDIVIDDVTH